MFSDANVTERMRLTGNEISEMFVSISSRLHVTKSFTFLPLPYAVLSIVFLATALIFSLALSRTAAVPPFRPFLMQRLLPCGSVIGVDVSVFSLPLENFFGRPNHLLKMLSCHFCCSHNRRRCYTVSHRLVLE